MESESEQTKGTLCDECREYGFCFRYDKEAFRKWHEQRFVLNINEVKNHVPVKMELRYSFGGKAQRKRKAYQNMYDAFHQDEYQLALDYAKIILEEHTADDTYIYCKILCYYFLGDYQYAHDLIIERRENHYHPYTNQLLREVLLDCKNKLWIIKLESELQNMEVEKFTPDSELDEKMSGVYISQPV